MFKTKCKKTVSKMILSFILITLTLLSGCQKNTTHSAIEFGTIDVGNDRCRLVDCLRAWRNGRRAVFRWQ